MQGSTYMRWVAPVVAVVAALAIWQGVCYAGWVPGFLLPSPFDVGGALVQDWELLLMHAGVTLVEALLGLAAGVVFGFALAALMDRFVVVYQALSPLVTLSQTIPTIAIAPLLVLWLGYGMLPKVALVALTTFFPITVSLTQGFRSLDRDVISLMRTMNASWWQIFCFAKLPGSAGQFFSGLKISTTYAVVGAVVAEWLGGFNGLGVYMTRVRKSYAYDEMFAVILIIAALSLALMGLVSLLQRACMPWKRAARAGGARFGKAGGSRSGKAGGARFGKAGGSRSGKAGVAVCLAGLLAATTLLTGCAGNKTQQENVAPESLTPVTFVLDWTPNTNHTGIYVAIEKGYYKDAGLEVTVVQPPDDGADAMVATGQAQFGVAFQDWMANYLGSTEPLPVTAVAAVIQHNTSGILSRAGTGIDRPAGLVGKRYGTWDLNVEKAIIKTLVEADGGKWEDVLLVPSNATDEVSGLRADMYDAVWVYEAWGAQNAKLQGYATDYFSLRSINDTFDFYTPVIIVNNQFAAQNPDVVREFLAATAKGYEFAAQNPEDAANILVEQAPEVDADLALASQKYLADLYIAEAPQWGYIDPVRWNKFYSWLNENGLVSVSIPENAGFTNDYLPKG